MSKLTRILSLFAPILATILLVLAVAVAVDSTATATGHGGSLLNYDGFKVFTITTTKGQLQLLNELKTKLNLDTWKEPTPFDINNHVIQTDLMVSPSDLSYVTKFLQFHRLPYRIKMEDVGSVVRQQQENSQKYQQEKKVRSGSTKIDWNDYYTLDQIYDWLDEIVANNSDIATVTVLGKSGQGRDLKMVKISLPGSPANKPAILIDGGIHAREWISPAVLTFIVNDVLTNRDANKELLEAVDLYLIPVLNVDGYEYTHTTDRMWRKTRSDLNDTVNGCIGVDGNRNFDFQFGGDGSSPQKCSDGYSGPYPFSEPETAMVRDLILDTTVNWKAYLTLHSYGQLWITPWGYTDELPEDHEEMMIAGNIGADALQAVHGTVYRVGPAPYAAGCSDDYAKGVGGIKYVHTLELRGGQYGFLLPAEQIVPSGEETWAGIRALSLHVSAL